MTKYKIATREEWRKARIELFQCLNQPVKMSILHSAKVTFRQYITCIKFKTDRSVADNLTEISKNHTKK